MSLASDLAAAIGSAGRPVALHVGCDIGGTNSRITLRLVDAASGAALATVADVWHVKSSRALLALFQELDTAVAGLGVKVIGAGLAITGAVVGGESVPVRAPHLTK